MDRYGPLPSQWRFTSVTLVLLQACRQQFLAGSVANAWTL